ncbi:FMN-binding negative transcriptional regulator [Winogradskyella aurantiaca]|uniref:FMN-binding negative transcriptional regulator n=1 Tax=Winogradskyella aurantiaca TaxID=2219558 RepID=UPI000E1D612B|nr:FMN-binding negative transcriptional regulator [Winogradskyella aurantiaca]
MKYPPQHHQDDTREHMIAVIKHYPLATVISVHENEPFVTHLPLVFEDNKLIGHIDIFNPHAKLLKDSKPVTIIFQGPQCYISPSVYSTTQLPTWNYVKVHIKGIVNAIENKEALKESLITMTEFLEGENPKYTLDADNPRMQRNLDYIEMFEISILEWEGKFKLSQDKKPGDRMAAREELISSNQKSIRLFLDLIF